ncbi:MAG: branched-chain amino acid transport system permease protein [Glaciecola sp.]|jgi:branched-chain amino acid transport system permease protein
MRSLAAYKNRIPAGVIPAVVVALIAIVQWDAIAPLFTTSRTVLYQGILTGILIGAIYGLVAMGLTLIFGVLEIVNFAHGAFMTVAMYLVFVLSTGLGLDPYLTLPLVVAITFVMGAFVQRVVIQRSMGGPLENQLLLTLGLSILIENLLLLGFSATPRTVRLSYINTEIDLGPVVVGFPLRIGGAVADLPRVIAFLGALAFGAVLHQFLRRTATGTAIRSVGQNPTGAALVGVDVRRIRVLTFGIGTAVVGVAGTLVLPFLSVEPITGSQFNILSFVVVVLGGLGNVTGALVAGILIGLTQQLGGLVFPGQSKLLLVFVVFVLTLFLRPQGIFGGKAE